MKLPYEYALILMDCSMPILDGYQTSKLIRKCIKNNKMHQPKIIATTGHTEEQYIQKAFDSEMNEVLPKPIDL